MNPNDKGSVLDYVSNSGRGLEYASPELKADREVVFLIVYENS